MVFRMIFHVPVLADADNTRRRDTVSGEARESTIGLQRQGVEAADSRGVENILSGRKLTRNLPDAISTPQPVSSYGE